MEIIRAEQADIGEIMILIKDCIRDMQAGGSDQWDDTYPTREIFDADIRNRTLFLAKEGALYQAVMALNEEQPPEYFELPWTTEGKILVVHRLAVRPHCQQRGIGRLLMEFAEDYGIQNGYRAIHLDTYSANTRAQGLFRRCGYQKLPVEFFFHGKRLPFYAFEKQLEISKEKR